jgi:ATP-dependent RNA helicase DeaD
MHKLDALTRILEAEPFDGMLVFTRTKIATEELAERLEARGFAVEALNGDIAQPQRERTIARLKAGQIDIVVATDVAARGLDVERVSHVVNYDVPYDPEAYVHRIGRTGRAGRSGEAILFIAPRERNMLRVIERATRQTIDQMELPSIQDVNDQRVARFNDRISAALAAGEGEAFVELIERFEREHNVPAVEIAAALASLAQGKKPLLMDVESKRREPEPREEIEKRKEPEQHKQRPRAESSRPPSDAEMETYRIEVGRDHGVEPGNIMGAIANEAGIEGKFIGRIVIRGDHSFVDLPEGMPKEIFRQLQKVRVAGQQLQISRALKTQTERLRSEHPRSHKAPHKRPHKAPHKGKAPRR